METPGTCLPMEQALEFFVRTTTTTATTATTTTTTTSRHFAQTGCLCPEVNSSCIVTSRLAVTAAGRDDGAGAARRRRERRLRSWLKHERQSVAMALSEYKHALKRTEEGQGRRGGAQGQVRSATATEAPSSPGFPATLSG